MTKRITGGWVHMGSPLHPREARRRTVHVGEFDLAHVHVLVSQYEVFLASGSADDPRWWSKEGWAWLTGVSTGWGRENRWQPDRWEAQRRRPYHPVVGVTRYEAQAYCAWLSRQTGRSVRLPSEEEWERAARGDDLRPFPWGEYFDSALTNTWEHALHDTLPAGSLPGDVGPYGAMDLAGNVQEWTTTPYTPLPDEPHPEGPLFVVRGGGFDDTMYGARTSYRRGYPPGYFYPFLGFRVLVEAV